MGKLYRSDNKVVAGVCAGIAECFGLDTKLVRFAWILFIILGGSGILFYLILWLIIPDKNNGANSYKERMQNKLGK